MAKSIKKNYIYNLCFQVLSIILPIITAPYLARVLGVEGVGTASFTLSIVAYFILFANLGIASFGQREIAMHQDDKKKYSKIFWDLSAYRLVVGALTTFAYLFLILFADKYQIIYGIMIVNLLGNVFDITWFFQGLEEYKFISMRNIAVKLLFAVSIFIFVRNPEDLNLYILLNGLSILISSLALWTRLPKLVEKPVIKAIRPFRYIKDTFIYFLPQIATTIYTVLDKTVLGLYDPSQTENGYYEQAYKIIQIATTVVTSISVVMAPRFAFLYKKNNIVELKERLRKSMKFIFMTAVPFAFGISAIASLFVPWFFGEEYLQVIDIMQVFAPVILIIALSSAIGGQCLTPCGMRFQSALVLMLGAAVNFGANMILIPKFWSFGAVAGTLLAEVVVTAGYFILARKYMGTVQTFKDATKYFVAGILMYIVVMLVKPYFAPTIVSTIIVTAIGAAVYGVSLIVMRDELLFEYMRLFWRKMTKK
ncbi:flippase [Candidatus Saccharibacteria bacterium]|nr:flippase [Candidatus Saccharibacteria bacterium]